MPLIPLFLQSATTSADADLMSAFNFCNPFDHVLPYPDATVSALDMQHLWGLATSVAAAGVDAHSKLMFVRVSSRLNNPLVQ